MSPGLLFFIAGVRQGSLRCQLFFGFLPASGNADGEDISFLEQNQRLDSKRIRCQSGKPADPSALPEIIHAADCKEDSARFLDPLYAGNTFLIGCARISEGGGLQDQKSLQHRVHSGVGNVNLTVRISL